MKICYVNPTILVRRPIAQLIDRLGDKHEVGIFIPKRPFGKIDLNWHSNKALKKAKIHHYNAVNPPLKFEWPIPFSFRFIPEIIKIFKTYDVVHMWTYFYLNSTWVLFIKLFFPKVKLIMSCDTFPAYSFKAGTLTDLMFKIYTKIWGKFLFGIPDKIHLYGKSLVKHAKKIGIDTKKIEVMPTGIDTKKFEDAKAGNIRKSLKLSSDDIILTYCGLVVPRKGIDTMLKTIHRIKDKKVKMLIVGDGPHKKKFVKMSQELGLEKRVMFLGWRQDVPSILKASNILFLPSRGEGLPGIVMEGMAAGLPIIASDIPCIPDLVEEGKNGHLCKMEDTNCFARRIGRLTEDTELRKKEGRHSLKKIKDFKWEKVLSRYLQMYNVRNNRNR